MFVGAAMLLLGAILGWITSWAWVRWLPLLGASLLALSFVPSVVVNLFQYPALITLEPRKTLGMAFEAFIIISCLWVSAKRLCSRQKSIS